MTENKQPIDVDKIIKEARESVNKLRDSTRVGRIVNFRERDELVIKIHKAIDLLEKDDD